MLKRRIQGVLLLLIVAIPMMITLSAQNAAAMAKLKKFFTNIAAYNQNYTQEKVYLHLDNNGYFPSEKIWFKAYVFKASTLLPTDLSKILYVELVTPMGEVKTRKTLPIHNGRTYGEFELDSLQESGYYEVRAYTRAMLNWDSHYIYSRVVPVFSVAKDTTQFNHLWLNDNPYDNRLLNKRKTPQPLLDEGSRKEGKAILSFYPEGGHIIKGVACRVAYKLTDELGEPYDAELKVCDASGTQVQTSRPQHEGMGVVELAENWTGGYVKVNDPKGRERQFQLPEPQERGVQLRTHVTDNGNLEITAQGSPSLGAQLVGVSVTCRGAACYFDTINVAGGLSRTKSVPRRQLKDGVQQVTLFTPEGEILGERLVWMKPLRKPMVLEVKQNQQSYEPFSPVVLDFTLKDGVGLPVQGEFSLSVQDVGGMVCADAEGLKTDMLLSSDLKGYIHNPEYYFEKDDEAHAAALDLLMMVQGWRRYEWNEMSGKKPFVLKQPAEDAQVVDEKS